MTERRPYLQWTDPAATEALARMAVDDEPQPWQDKALCAQVDPETWYPEKGGSVREAKAVCGRCEVRAECLEYGLERSLGFGIFGGLSPQERRRLKRGMADAA